MNTPNPKPRAFGNGSEMLMAFLLIIAFVQIVLCFQAGAGLVRPDLPEHLDSAVSTVQTHTPAVRGDNAVTNAGFQSVPTRS